MRARCVALLTAVLAAPAMPGPAPAAAPWFLLSRHGECSPIRALRRKFPDLGPIAQPQAFIDFVRAKGLAVSSKALPVQAGAAVEVLVPEQDLALVFVTRELCAAGPAR